MLQSNVIYVLYIYNILSVPLRTFKTQSIHNIIYYIIIYFAIVPNTYYPKSIITLQCLLLYVTMLYVTIIQILREIDLF